MKKFFVFFLILCSCGCYAGPGYHERTTSQLNVIIRRDFNEKNFSLSGKTGDKDMWKNDILWEMTPHSPGYTLYVRSIGRDELPYTKDDIIVSRMYGVGDISENFVKSIFRGAVTGIREGIEGR